MARLKKDAPVDLSITHDLSAGLIQRLICPTGLPKAFLRDKDITGLKVRVTSNGGKSFVYEAKLSGEAISRTLGTVSLMTISEAKAQAQALAKLVKTDKQDPRERERLNASSKATAQASQLQAKQFILKKMLLAYCDYLKKLERKSHTDARSIFNLHVFEA
jgi:hypothetical protein